MKEEKKISFLSNPNCLLCFECIKPKTENICSIKDYEISAINKKLWLHALFQTLTFNICLVHVICQLNRLISIAFILNKNRLNLTDFVQNLYQLGIAKHEYFDADLCKNSNFLQHSVELTDMKGKVLNLILCLFFSLNPYMKHNIYIT